MFRGPPVTFKLNAETAESAVRLSEVLSESLLNAGYELDYQDSIVIRFKSRILTPFLGGSWSKFAAFDRLYISVEQNSLAISLTSNRILLIVISVFPLWGLAFFWHYPVLVRLIYGLLAGMSVYGFLILDGFVRVRYWMKRLQTTSDYGDGADYGDSGLR